MNDVSSHSYSSLVLASTSPFRKALLEEAGIRFQVIPPQTEEAEVRAASARVLAARRAAAKALSLAVDSGILVLGSDQVLECEGKPWDKAKSQAEARTRLQMLAGNTHHLYSAYCLAAAGQTLVQRVVTASLTMRPLKEQEIERYLETGEWQGSVGCYKFEQSGAELFSSVVGDTSTIVGLPMTELREDLRTLGYATP